MSDYLYIGKVVNTHGVKGEIKILSDFEFKDRLFKINNSIYINDKNYKIVAYRVHKNYDMVMLEHINNLEDASKLKGNLVYAKREVILKNEEYVIEDLISFKVIYFNNIVGEVKHIDLGVKYNYLVLSNNKYIPYINEFIKKVDIKDKTIYINDIEGLL